MATKKKTAKPQAKKKKKNLNNEVFGVICIAVGLLLFISLIITGDTGIIKKYLADGVLRGTFGIFAYVVPFIFIFAGVMAIALKTIKIHKGKLTMSILLVLATVGIVHMIFDMFVPIGTAKEASDFFSAVLMGYEAGKENMGMGAFASVYVYPLTALLGNVGSIIVFIATILISFIVLFNLSLKEASVKVGEKVKTSFDEAGERIRRKKKNYDYELDDEPDDEPELPKNEENSEFEVVHLKREEPNKNNDIEKIKERHIPVICADEQEPANDFDEKADNECKPAEQPILEAPQDVLTKSTQEYCAPPINLLNAPAANKRNTNTDHSEKIEMMETTLKSFGIEAWVQNITVGPAITRYELSIQRGTRVSKILNLADDIALSMAAVGVRIEAPIPGKSAIGIEIPNDTVSMVTLREVLESNAFKENKSPVAVGLGKDITGAAVVADLSKMPHLLIAGQTGAGKSVCINSIITSLIYKSSPEDVKMILVDPKKVELNVYNGIPHLMTPVVTDPKKAAGALQFVVREMEKRYETFAKRKVKDIGRYNEVAAEAGEKTMPRIVVIVDELNDLMLVARGEVEDSVMRIAQLARAAGIYLILATQRPSVNVITGVIKANIPSRIAFAVASGIDSKTILDTTGAEKLVGKGDMLFHLNGENKPTRVQGAFVGEQEIEKVVEFLKSSNKKAEYIGEEQLVMRELKPTHGGSAENPNDIDAGSDEDDLFPAAVEYAIEQGSISISALQRRFKVGYSRAGRLIDAMELRGIVESSQGAKPRQVLMTREQFWAAYDERLD